MVFTKNANIEYPYLKIVQNYFFFCSSKNCKCFSILFIIHFLNKYIQDSEVNLYFSAADLCVLPYRTATQSGITATSFHFDVPILATNVGGFKSQIETPGMGIVVDRPDALLIQNGIEKYFNENLKSQFVEAIHVEKSKNTWEMYADRLISFCQELR